MVQAVEKPGYKAIKDAKKPYAAGVLKYRQMGYWDPDYSPADTDIICLFRITPQPGTSIASLAAKHRRRAAMLQCAARSLAVR